MARIIVFTAMMWALLAGAGHGHGVSFEVSPERAVAVRFAFSGGEPMSYAEVEVFGPRSAPDLEFQNGRTDARGVFAFVPDRPGKWRITAWDGTGHRGEMSIDVTEAGSAPETGPTAGSAPTLANALLGVSLLANIALAAALLKRRRQ